LSKPLNSPPDNFNIYINGYYLFLTEETEELAITRANNISTLSDFNVLAPKWLEFLIKLTSPDKMGATGGGAKG
jgi:hypothetical protein